MLKSNLTQLTRPLRHAIALLGLLAAGTSLTAPPAQAQPSPHTATAEGVIRVRSAYPFDATVTRIEAAVRRCSGWPRSIDARRRSSNAARGGNRD